MAGPVEYEELFLATVPTVFLQDAARGISDAYLAASEECYARYPRAVAHDLTPHVRRAIIERDLLAVARKHPGLGGDDTPNRRGSSFHTLVHAGPIVLTESMVASPDTPVRYAAFRFTYARSSQLSLFEPSREPDPGAPLYAILLHGPDELKPSRPAFITVRFPLPDCSAYVGRIDLIPYLERRPVEPAAIAPEIIEDAARPTLRPSARAAQQQE